LLQSAKPLWVAAEARFANAFGQTNALGLRAMMRQITTVYVLVDGQPFLRSTREDTMPFDI
jgi:hypothetical protein